MNQADFTLHDVSAFPIVRLRSQGLPAGYTRTWVAELETLMRGGAPFVLIFLDTIANEAQEDRKTRMQRLKANKAALVTLCHGIISVEPNTARRLARQAQAVIVSKAFGFRLAVTTDIQEAEQLARGLLADE
jgi:pantothenate kinase-related protein Tda10